MKQPTQLAHGIGDYQKIFEDYHTETDIKTKIMFLSSNPKGYNIDKMLSFLASDKIVFLFYFIGIDSNREINTILVSLFDDVLIDATIILRHWAGRNSRGVTQFNGEMIKTIINGQKLIIDTSKAIEFIQKLIDL